MGRAGPGRWGLTALLAAAPCTATTPALSFRAPVAVPQVPVAAAMLPSDPRNVPGDGWPGATVEASQRAWPAGQQPPSLASWPRRSDGEIDRCWQTQILYDLGDGWSGQGSALQHKDLHSKETCRVACLNDPWCSVWQYSSSRGCWQGQGNHGDGRNGRDARELQGSQMILHGEVRVLKRLVGLDVHGLHNIGFSGAGDPGEEVQHCKNICYSDILCQYWQYGDGGCRVEDPRNRPDLEYPLTLSGASQVTEFAKTVVDGEFVQHICPPRTAQALSAELGAPGSNPLDPLGEGSIWRYVPYIIASALTSLLLACLSACFWDAREHQLASNRMSKPERCRSMQLLDGSESEGDEDSLLDDDRPPRFPRMERGLRWTVKVDRSQGAKVGMDMDYGDRRTLLVKKIQAGGLLAKWNESCGPTSRVRIGDRIVAVNGLEGARKGVRALMDEMRKNQVLLLTVHRDNSAPASPDVLTELLAPLSQLEASPPASQMGSLPGSQAGSRLPSMSQLPMLPMPHRESTQLSAPPPGGSFASSQQGAWQSEQPMSMRNVFATPAHGGSSPPVHAGGSTPVPTSGSLATSVLGTPLSTPGGQNRPARLPPPPLVPQSGRLSTSSAAPTPLNSVTRVPVPSQVSTPHSVSHASSASQSARPSVAVPVASPCQRPLLGAHPQSRR